MPHRGRSLTPLHPRVAGSFGGGDLQRAFQTDALRPIAIEELLGCDVVPSDPQLLGFGIAGQLVLLSGAVGLVPSVPISVPRSWGTGPAVFCTSSAVNPASMRSTRNLLEVSLRLWS